MTGRAPRATIDDVAREAGVSTATVSRALSAHPHVAPATKRKVDDAVRRLGYVANSNAARLASGQSRTVGLLAPSLGGWYQSEVVAGVEEVLAAERYDLLIGTADPRARQRIFQGDPRFNQHIDAVLLVDVFCSEEGALRLARLGMPAVVLGEPVHAVDSVSVDNVAGGLLAAQHLLALGHRHVALVGGGVRLDVAHHVPTERREGFVAGLAAAGVTLDQRYEVDGEFTIDGGARAMAALLDLPEPPTAVFLMSDEMAFGALQTLRERGLRAGGDVSVIGFDDHPVAAAAGLSTVRQPVREIGRLGGRLVLDALAADAPAASAPQHHVMDLELVARDSTAAVR